MKNFKLSRKSVLNRNSYAVYSSQRITSCSAREMINGHEPTEHASSGTKKGA